MGGWRGVGEGVGEGLGWGWGGGWGSVAEGFNSILQKPRLKNPLTYSRLNSQGVGGGGRKTYRAIFGGNVL